EGRPRVGIPHNGGGSSAQPCPRCIAGESKLVLVSPLFLTWEEKTPPDGTKGNFRASSVRIRSRLSIWPRVSETARRWCRGSEAL
ncbi:unnamed protein product, partial [Gulo gulo]